MDDQLVVDKQQVKNAVKAILEYVEKTEKKDLSATLEPELIRLQLGFKKIPAIKNKIIKIDLPTPLLVETSEIVLFVKDDDKSSRDYDQTIQHYKELLAACGITNIDIMPLKCLKLEHKEYEAQRNLSNMYDIFLADGRIVRLLPQILGKHFYGRKKYPLQVNMLAKDLKKEINRVLSRTQCIMSGRGSNCGLTVAHSGMTVKQITANVEEAIKKLSSTLPGGKINVKNIHIKSIRSPALPLFVDLGKTEDVVLPKKRTREPSPEPEDVSTVEHGLVKVSKYGRISVFPFGENHKDSDDKNDGSDSDDCNDLDSDDVEESVPAKKPHRGNKNKKLANKPKSWSSGPPTKKKKVEEKAKRDISAHAEEENLEEKSDTSGEDFSGIDSDNDVSNTSDDKTDKMKGNTRKRKQPTQPQPKRTKRKINEESVKKAQKKAVTPVGKTASKAKKVKAAKHVESRH